LPYSETLEGTKIGAVQEVFENAAKLMNEYVAKRKNTEIALKAAIAQAISLPLKLRGFLIEILLEDQRKGNFLRIYPAKNSDAYDQYLSQKSINKAVYSFLYSEVFCSFKKASKFSFDQLEKH
jgi:hypothetical protein